MTKEQITDVKNRFNVVFIYYEKMNTVRAAFSNVRELHKNQKAYDEFVLSADYDIPAATTILSCAKLWEGVHEATEEELCSDIVF